MNSFLLDASSLAKRYYVELGTPLVDHLFANATKDRLCCLMLGVAEVAATLARKRNGGFLKPADFAVAMKSFYREILHAADFRKLPCENPLIENSIPLSDRHSLNSNDAIVLQVALELDAQIQVQGDRLVLVASDQRLLRAAQTEAVATFDPETQPLASLDALLAS